MSADSSARYAVLALAFSKDSTRIVSGGAAQPVRVWDASPPASLSQSR
jgi:WD40 repeat protein